MRNQTRLEYRFVLFASDPLRDRLSSPAITSSAEYALTLFGAVVLNSCAHFVEDLFHPELKSYANKLIGYIFKWRAM